MDSERLHLEEVDCSEAYWTGSAASHLQIVSEPAPLQFDANGDVIEADAYPYALLYRRATLGHVVANSGLPASFIARVGVDIFFGNDFVHVNVMGTRRGFLGTSGTQKQARQAVHRRERFEQFIVVAFTVTVRPPFRSKATPEPSPNPSPLVAVAGSHIA